MDARLAILNAIQIAVPYAKNPGGSSQTKGQLRRSIGNEHAPGVFDPKFNVANILAIGAQFQPVRHQLDSRGCTCGLQGISCQRLPIVIFCDGSECPRCERNFPAQNTVFGFQVFSFRSRHGSGSR